MNKKFNVISENNLEYIDFHDCECSRLYYENDTLVLEMDCMEVLSEHPMNPHDKAHQSGAGMVMLHLPTIEQLVLYKNNSEIISVNDLNNVDFQDTILLQYDESKTNGGYKAKIYLLFNSNKEFDSALIEISYNKSVAMWDELKDVSWFEVK